jgi:hypothetical protein
VVYKDQADAVALESYLNAYISEKWSLFDRDRAVDFNACIEDLHAEFDFLPADFRIWDWQEDSFLVYSYPVR